MYFKKKKPFNSNLSYNNNRYSILNLFLKSQPSNDLCMFYLDCSTNIPHHGQLLCTTNHGQHKILQSYLHIALLAEILLLAQDLGHTSKEVVNRFLNKIGKT